eukprot:4397671-Amphidinium_carterae.1
MPDPSKGSIESTPKAVLSAVSTFLQVSKTLRTEAGLQATEVGSMLSNVSKQRTSRIPLNLEVGFTP